MLSKKEQSRYKRQLLLPEFGEQAQELLKNAKVLVVGAGGLGSPVCYYLAAAGIGHLVVCDRDKVELSNLNRQILHGSNDLEKDKAKSAYETLCDLNADIQIETHTISVDDSTIADLANGAIILVDCLDNIETRMVLNRFSLKNSIPIMHAGIDGWNGQITLLNPPETLCMKCLFGEAEDTNEAKPVLGALVGVLGTMQALETIKFIIGKSTIENQMLYFDGLNMEWTKIPVGKNKDCISCSI